MANQLSRPFTFTTLSNAILDDDRLGKHEILVYLALCRHASNDTRSAFPSMATLAKESRLSRSTVQESLAKLEAFGYLQKEQRTRANGSSSSNLYKLMEALPLPQGGPPPSVARAPHPPQGGPPLNYTHLELNPSNKDMYSSEFEKFWELYPRKLKKKATFKNWTARLKEGIEVSVLMTCLAGYNRKVKSEKTEIQFIAHPTTFTNSDHYFLDYEKFVPSDDGAIADGTDKQGNRWKGGKIIGHYDGARYIPHSKPADAIGLLGGSR